MKENEDEYGYFDRNEAVVRMIRGKKVGDIWWSQHHYRIEWREGQPVVVDVCGYAVDFRPGRYTEVKEKS